MFYEHLKGHIEALLFTSGDALTASQLAQILEIDEEHIPLLVETLKKEMEGEKRGLTVIEVAGGYQLCTKPELAAIVEKLAKVHQVRLSVAAMETLSIIAFKQPITRQEIENLRGVQVDKLLSMLLERGLIKEVGRKEAIGRPILYGTTNQFLQCFGLKTLQDLPDLSQFLTESD
ncbi:chromosome segregation/condensation protein scpb [Lucifera butyrica]|uniref:Segregation and condensation protein B n=1 Tax=Lucifera butyrica TaxID=1351585 RepID=A0A498RAH6_9FIRM|nr:SMC-Scp complex subunit ScpB [Lucifera butyrica]VBB07975.1 chromosome segregation/condensation protein scpb [Lucifera butyrica]